MTPPAATAAGTRTLPRTVAPRAPRRVSGPQTRTRRGEDARRDGAKKRARAGATDPFIFRVLRGSQQLADSRLLDRLIRGRLWIPLVAAGLMGIVFMQVSMLKLNAGIGRAVQASGTLERQNSSLRAEVSRLEAGSRIDGAAHALGMVVPADGTAKYVTAAGRDQAATAAKRMVAADPDAIARAKAGTALAQGQAATGTGTIGAATAAAPSAQGQAPAATQTQTQAATPTGTTATTPPAAATTPPAATGTGTGATTGAGTTGAGTTPPAAAQQQPSAGAATPAAQAQPQQQTAQPSAATTSGGAVAPAQG